MMCKKKRNKYSKNAIVLSISFQSLWTFSVKSDTFRSYYVEVCHECSVFVEKLSFEQIKSLSYKFCSEYSKLTNLNSNKSSPFGWICHHFTAFGHTFQKGSKWTEPIKNNSLPHKFCWNLSVVNAQSWQTIEFEQIKSISTKRTEMNCLPSTQSEHVKVNKSMSTKQTEVNCLSSTQSERLAQSGQRWIVCNPRKVNMWRWTSRFAQSGQRWIVCRPWPDRIWQTSIRHFENQNIKIIKK